MPDKPAAQEARPEQPPSPPKKKPPIKALGAVGVLMMAEAAVLFFVVGMGGPAKSHASTSEHDLAVQEGERTREVLIVDGRFQNQQSGQLWSCETAIYAQVKNKNADLVEAILKRRNAEVLEGINQIIARAQPAHLKEPERQTLNRQVRAFLDKVLMAEDTKESLVERVLIPKWASFTIDL